MNPLCEIYIQSLCFDSRKKWIEYNKELYPNIKIFKSVNGYNIEEVINEFKQLKIIFHYIQHTTYGALANWITKLKAFQYQIDNSIEYMCLLEDDVLLDKDFQEHINKILPMLNTDINIIRLHTWGEGYITSKDGAKKIISLLRNDGVIKNIDNQLKENCGKEYFANYNFKLMCPTNHGDCLKTQIFNIEDFKKKVEEKNNLTIFLNDNNFYSFEGHCQLEMQKVNHLIQLTNTPNISVMEIGFNAGHSAEVFLENNSSLTLTSFDLCEHKYVHTGKKYIDKTYPNRHVLITGDSTISIPSYINNNKNKKFDVIFIDGSNEYDIINLDLKNCINLAHKDTIVVLDDIIYKNEWKMFYTLGPTKTWEEHIQNNKITELKRNEYGHGSGMSWGKYNI